MSQFYTIFMTIWRIIIGIFREFWWIILPLILFNIFRDLLKLYLKELRKKESNFICLQLLFSEEACLKPLRFMELFFDNLKNLKLEEDQNISCEIVGIDNQLKYFIRMPEKAQDLIAIILHSQYPNVELVQVDDYFSRIPPNVPNNEFSFWSKEYKYKKGNPFPLLTYENFYNIKTQEKLKSSNITNNIIEPNSYDPLSVIIEIFNRIRPDDIISVQCIIRNLNDKEKTDWDFEAQSIYNPLIGKAAPQKPESVGRILTKSIGDSLNSAITSVITSTPTTTTASTPKTTTDTEQATIKNIEKKISGTNYKSSIRLNYISRPTDFSNSVTTSLEMFLKQFNNPCGNSIEEIKNDAPLVKMKTKIRNKIFPYIPTQISRQMFQKAINRKPSEKEIIISSKELASIFHFPFQNIYLSSVVMKKNRPGSPPPNLPYIP